MRFREGAHHRASMRACVRAVPAALSGGKVARVGWLCQASKASNLVTTTVSTMHQTSHSPNSEVSGWRAHWCAHILTG
jgi:hypothetical protein